jgi:sulfite exporter TauE/SafE/copper chaperone CopZ
MTTEDKNNLPAARLAISGMTCTHCEVAVERALMALPGMRRVTVDYRSGIADIVSDEPIDLSRINGVLKEEGYGASEGPPEPAKSKGRVYSEAAAAVLIVLGLFFLARQFDLLPRGLSVTDNMTYGFVFVIGLVASVSSCMAVTGGLLVALAAKYNEATRGLTARQRFIPHLYFNTGRILSYTILGGLIGAAGSALALSPMTTGVLTIVLSVVMIVVGLQMLGVVPPLGRLFPLIPKSTVHRIHDLVASEAKGSAFVLGAASFFLPCGFTLALQLYVLTKGSAAVGALTMLVFALGTLPALLSLSVISSFASGAMQTKFLRLAGAAVIFLGFMNIQYGLVQTGSSYVPVSPLTAAQPETAAAQPMQSRQVQIAEMKIDGYEYIPNRFTVKAGIPVEWRIDAREAEGCGRILIMRKAGIVKFLSSDQPTVITFTPEQPGELAFNCSMGMMTPNSGFTVTN